ncbi:MAG: OmpA family protein, partial [Chitinophagaceae bacterium]|nr:OmpA family protein [Chitinophagaceae bacterium]
DRNLLIYGYADYLGNEPSNLDLAIGRAKNVKTYLLNKNVSAVQILICEGIGEVKRPEIISGKGIPEDRRVAVFIKKPFVKATKMKDEIPVPKKKGIQIAEIKDDGKLIPIAKKSLPSTSTRNAPVEHLLVGQRTSASATINKPPIASRFDGLNGLKTNEVMRIEAIHFLATRHFITKESEPILQELLQTMNENPNLAINIEGHVCCMKGEGDALDTDTYELKLSENRAKFIYLFLIQNGIASNRLGYVGFGKRKPIVEIELTEEDAQKNRRVEFRLIRK